MFGAPPAIFGLCAVIFLALHVFRININSLNVFIMAAAAFAAAYAAAFAYFYSADYEVFTGGLIARRASMLVFSALCFMVVFALRRKKHGSYFFPAVSAIMFIIAAAIQAGDIPTQAAAFFSADLFSVLIKKKETEAWEGVPEEAVF